MQIYHLRKGGKTFSEIYRDYYQGILNYDQMVALYRSTLTKMARSYGLEERQQMLMLELDRYDALQDAYWTDALAGDKDAAKLVLQTMAQRARVAALDQVTAADKTMTQNVLIISGENYQEALDHARSLPMAGSTLDDEDGSEVP